VTSIDLILISDHDLDTFAQNLTIVRSANEVVVGSRADDGCLARERGFLPRAPQASLLSENRRRTQHERMCDMEMTARSCL
jgi:hypothetical protein